MVRGFSRAEYATALSAVDPVTGYGTLSWQRQGASWVGTFLVYPHPSLPPDLEVEIRFMAHPMRPEQPSVVFRLGGKMASRVDVNGLHSFPDGTRKSTHRQSQPAGHDTPEVTVELSDQEFPPLSLAVATMQEANYEPLFRAAARLFNFEVSTVEWVDPPDDGGAW